MCNPTLLSGLYLYIIPWGSPVSMFTYSQTLTCRELHTTSICIIHKDFRFYSSFVFLVKLIDVFLKNYLDRGWGCASLGFHGFVSRLRNKNVNEQCNFMVSKLNHTASSHDSLYLMTKVIAHTRLVVNV